MYVVDITREDNSTDMLVGNDSMSAKSKTINYVMDYVFANYNISDAVKTLVETNLNISGVLSLLKESADYSDLPINLKYLLKIGVEYIIPPLHVFFIVETD